MHIATIGLALAHPKNTVKQIDWRQGETTPMAIDFEPYIQYLMEGLAIVPEPSGQTQNYSHSIVPGGLLVTS